MCDGDPEDPLTRGADVEVYRVAALLEEGSRVDEVKEDYPLLSLDQIKRACDYARAVPKQGRPYRGNSSKRATRELSLHLIDELLAQEGSGERKPNIDAQLQVVSLAISHRPHDASGAARGIERLKKHKSSGQREVADRFGA
jgi:hypothetical protein